MPIACIQFWDTPDEGQWTCPKRAQYFIKKIWEIVRLIDFYHKNKNVVFNFIKFDRTRLNFIPFILILTYGFPFAIFTKFIDSQKLCGDNLYRNSLKILKQYGIYSSTNLLKTICGFWIIGMTFLVGKYT